MVSVFWSYSSQFGFSSSPCWHFRLDTGAEAQPSALEHHIYKEKQTSNFQPSVRSRANVPGGKPVVCVDCPQPFFCKTVHRKIFKVFGIPRELEDPHDQGHCAHLFLHTEKVPLREMFCLNTSNVKMDFQHFKGKGGRLYRKWDGHGYDVAQLTTDVFTWYVSEYLTQCTLNDE